jgi:hypothetical protein
VFAETQAPEAVAPAQTVHGLPVSGSFPWVQAAGTQDPDLHEAQTFPQLPQLLASV